MLLLTLIVAYLAVGGVSFLLGWSLSGRRRSTTPPFLLGLAVAMLLWPNQLVAYHFTRCGWDDDLFGHNH